MRKDEYRYTITLA